MKNLFGLDIGQENAEIDGAAFIIREQSKEHIAKLEELSSRAQYVDKRSILPVWMVVAEVILLLGAFILFAGVMGGIARAGFETAKENGVWWYLIAAVVCAAGYLAIFLVARKKQKAAENSLDVTALAVESEDFMKESLSLLNVPNDAAKVDVFGFPYSVKKGKRVRTNKMFHYTNLEMRLFVENDMLCINDLSTVFGIPKDCFTEMVRIKKKVTVFGWNKEEAPNSPTYKPYKLMITAYGTLNLKEYCSLRFTKEGEDYEMLIPPYEAEKFTRLLGITERVLEEQE